MVERIFNFVGTPGRLQGYRIVLLVSTTVPLRTSVPVESQSIDHVFAANTELASAAEQPSSVAANCATLGGTPSIL